MPRPSPWHDYLDGRFDAAHPRRTLWRLLLAQRRDLGAAALFYIVKQAPGWALPLATGTIIDALTPPRAPTAGRTVAITLGIFVAVLVQNIVFHGHDHLFVKEELDGIIYQDVPQPGHPSGGTRSAAPAKRSRLEP